MSTDIKGLIDRTYREYLEPMDDLTSYTTLETEVDSSATTIIFNGDLNRKFFCLKTPLYFGFFAVTSSL